MIGFLLDEHVPPFIQAQLARIEPAMRVHLIGEETTPVKGSPDPDILVWIEANDCMLVTNHRASMPVHLADHLVLARHVPGIIQLLRRMNVGMILDDWWLIWAAVRPGEFQDHIIHLPLPRRCLAGYCSFELEFKVSSRLRPNHSLVCGGSVV